MLSQNAVTANTVKKEKKEFGISDKLGYMFGDLGNCFILGLVNSFLMIYYTNVLGVSGAIVGTLFLISRILDAFADVMVGRLCDVSELTENGRFIPWIRKMKYPFCLVTVILFLPFVQHLPMTVKVAYIMVFFCQQSISLTEQWQQPLVQILMTAPRYPHSEALVLRLAGQLQGSLSRF